VFVSRAHRNPYHEGGRNDGDDDDDDDGDGDGDDDARLIKYSFDC
jgi:hypothetical protein